MSLTDYLVDELVLWSSWENKREITGQETFVTIWRRFVARHNFLTQASAACLNFLTWSVACYIPTAWTAWLASMAPAAFLSFPMGPIALWTSVTSIPWGFGPASSLNIWTCLKACCLYHSCLPVTWTSFLSNIQLPSYWPMCSVLPRVNAELLLPKCL